MKKRNISIISLIILFSTNLISASFHYGYNRFSFRGFLDSVDPSTMILITLFSLIFLILTLILKRLPLFRDSYGYPNRAMIGITSAIISLFTIWWVNRSGLGIEDFFYSIGLSSDLLYVILPIIILIAIIFISLRFGFAAAFLIFGLLLMALTLFTEVFYEKGLVAFVGVVLLVIGLWLWNRSRRRRKGLPGGGIVAAGKYIGGKYDWEKEKRQARRIRRGAKRMVGMEDPREKLQRYERKRREAESKETARRRISEMGAQERQEKEVAKRRLQEPKEEARRQNEAQRQQKLQQNEEVRKQREQQMALKQQEKERRKAEKVYRKEEEARKFEEGQKRMYEEQTRRLEEAKQQMALKQQEKERRKAKEQTYKEEARIQKLQQEQARKAEEARRQELERQARRENYKRMKEEMRRAKER